MNIILLVNSLLYDVWTLSCRRQFIEINVIKMFRWDLMLVLVIRYLNMQHKLRLCILCKIVATALWGWYCRHSENTGNIRNTGDFAVELILLWLEWLSWFYAVKAYRSTSAVTRVCFRPRYRLTGRGEGRGMDGRASWCSDIEGGGCTIADRPRWCCARAQQNDVIRLGAGGHRHVLLDWVYWEGEKVTDLTVSLSSWSVGWLDRMMVLSEYESHQGVAVGRLVWKV